MKRGRPVIATLLASLLFAAAHAEAEDAPSGGTGSGSSGSTSSGSGPAAGATGSGNGTGTGASPGATGAGTAGAAPTALPSPYAPPAGASIAGASAYLPSSSKPSTDTSRASDYFDLAPPGGGSQVVHGNPNSSYSAEGRVEAHPPVPQVHTVQRGDTLWELCDRYFNDPWAWPRVWSYNPALQNPHWIYPGDQLKLQPEGGGQPSGREATGFVGRKRTVPVSTVFLRDQGYIDDAEKDTWGEVSGSPEDQLLLSDGDDAYLDIRAPHEVKPGEELTVFRSLKGALRGESKDSLVKILGTVRVERWDPAARVARARLVESLDVIERGASVGPVARKFDIVPPAANRSEVWGKVAASLYPHVLYGQNQVVFIDHGQSDGLVPGNRLFVISHGDEYRKTLVGASEFAAASVQYESEKPAVIELGGALGHGDDRKYPDEVVGELRVVSVREHSAACLVTGSLREIEPGQRVVARQGY